MKTGDSPVVSPVARDCESFAKYLDGRDDVSGLEGAAKMLRAAGAEIERQRARADANWLAYEAAEAVASDAASLCHRIANNGPTGAHEGQGYVRGWLDAGEECRDRILASIGAKP